jgi:hypothetical protein
MLWSGVFERFPGLRFGVTEAGCWWMPGLLWFWDRLFLGQKGAEKLASLGITTQPSELFDRNCFIGSSNTKRREIGMRYEIGLDNMLWGNDFPHPEGTWPYTARFLRSAFWDIPVDETALMLGESAAAFYGFDVDALRPLAERIGPTREDLGQTTPDAATAREKWVGIAEAGRPWVTGIEAVPVPVRSTDAY